MSHTFFDLDNTLYKGKLRHVILDFPQYLFERGMFSTYAINELNDLRTKYSADKIDRTTFALEVIKYYYAGLKDTSTSIIHEAAQFFWRDTKNTAWFPYTIELIKLLNTHTETIVVSGSPIEVLDIVFDELGVDKLFATSGTIIDNKYTGEFELSQEMATAEAKKLFIARYTEMASYNYEQSFAFGDSESDYPLLEAVPPQNAFLFTHKANLMLYGKEMGWNVLSQEDDITQVVSKRISEIFRQ